MDMVPEPRRWQVLLGPLMGIVLQLAGAGAGVGAALAAGGGGPARAAGVGAAGQPEAGMRWLVLAGAIALVLAVSVATWWRVGDWYSLPVGPAAGRVAGKGAVLVAIVAAAWLTWASLRHEFDLRWWSVLGPLLPAGIL